MAKTEEEFVNEGLTPDEQLAASASPEPIAEVQEAPEPEGQQAPTTAQDEPKMVDVRALQEARAEARAAREEAARFKTEQTRLEERLNILNQAWAAQQKPQEQAKPVPTLEEDPLGFMQHKFDTIEQQLKSREEAEKRNQSISTQEVQRQQKISEADYYINQAISKDQTLQEAIDFAFTAMKTEISKELESRSVPLDQRHMVGTQWFNNMIAKMAEDCPRDPERAAEFVRRNARYYGWGYGQPQQNQQQATQQRATPQELAQRQERHMSLSSISGGETMPQLDINALAKMSDDEFRKIAAKLGDKGLDKLMGAA